ncbi:MAG TPA: peptidylprolyl isomerase, partial [Prosthecobacter sp.]|nr:peptidylprolyl isomerase [Prosthecobacter sp.]
MFAPSRFCFSIFCALIAVTVAGLTPEARAVAPLAPSNIKVDMTLAVDADSAAQAGISYDSSATYLIRWTDNAFDEEGYRVEVRLGNGGPFTPLQYLRGNSDACLVWLPHFPKNTLLQFMVYAYKSNGAAVEASAAPVFSHMVGLSSSPITPIPPPIAPTNLTAELVGDGVVKLKWTDNGKDEVYHQVLYKKHGDTDFESVGYVYFNVTEAAMQPGLIPGEVYDFQVRATRKAPKDGVSFGGQSHVSTLSNTATVTAPPLLAPTHLTGVVTGEATVRLSWKDNSTNETGYQLEYKELPNGTFITPSWAVVAANTSTITVPVSPGIFTEWRVRAIYKEEGMSAAVESAATDPTLTLGTEFPAPSDLVAVTSPKAGAVDLAWKDNTSAETGFDILSRRAGSEDNFTLALSVPGGTTTATITSRLNNDGTDTVLLELDQTHEFKVLAKYGSVSSAATAVATAAAKHGFTSRFYNGGTVGEEYTSVNRYVLQTDQDVTVTEGVKNWNIANLEQVGLSFNNSSGVVEGTPTQHGIHTFPLTATFANGWVAHGTLTLRILRARADVVAGPIPNTTIAPKTTFNISLADKFSDPESERAVRLETTKGNIDILLYPSLAPEAVANFLAYVEAGDYNGVVFHRSLPGFVIQAGALKAVAAPKSYSSVAARPSPKNEPGISNLTGTISAAKVDKNPHSATHDFFLNLVDNNVDNPLSSVPALDNQNGGFTVFGRVATPAANRAQGLDVVYPVLHAIASLPRGNYYDFNSGGTYNESLDKSVLVDGFSANFADWPMDVSDSAPADMNLLKNVFIEKAYEIPTISHSVFSNSAPEVVSASIVNGELQVRGLKEGVAEVVVKGTDLENTAAQSTFQVTVTPNHKGPVITKHPASLVVMPGAKATFTVTATGTALTYQWRKRDGSGNFVNLGGETGKSLVIDGVQVANTGIYDVIVTNATTSLTSNPASLDFKTAPAITNPQPRVVNVGQPLTLEIEATGAPAPA